MKKAVWLLGGALAFALGAGQALAVGKAGLWNVTMNMNLANAPQIPPEALAQMRALGMNIPGLGAPIRTQACLTAAQAANDEPPPMEKGCRNQNFRRNGQTITGDVVCTGELTGTGSFEVTLVSDEQYRTKFNFKGTRRGQPADFSADMEGQWVSTNCGNVAPYTP